MNLEEERTLFNSQVASDLAEWQSAGSPASCGAGCSACCKLYRIKCLPEEVAHIATLGMEVDMVRLQAQVDDWNSADKTCVFLVDDLCSIHANKPFACSTHNVYTNAVHCITGDSQVDLITHTLPQTRLRQLYRDQGSVYLHEELHRILTA
jgi:Fe-S-cluster containining protein